MRKTLVTAAMLVSAMVLGAVVGPSVVQAAGSFVSIKDPKTNSKARVIGGRLQVSASGSVTGSTVADTPSYFIGSVYSAAGGETKTLSTDDVVIYQMLSTGGSHIVSANADVDCDGTGGDVIAGVSYVTGDNATDRLLWDGGMFLCGPVTVSLSAGQRITLIGHQVVNPGAAASKLDGYLGTH